MPNTTQCDKCGSEIVFLKTDKGKWMPVDYDDNVQQGEKFWDKNRHSSHFDTCPEAAHFRRSK